MKTKLSKLISNITTRISLFLILIFGIVWISTIYIHYKKNVEELRSISYKQKTEYISSEINRTISLLDYNYSLKMKRIKKQVKQRVYEAYTISQKIYEKHKDSKNKDEIILLIKESLRNIRFFGGTGYFFIYDLTGKSILHPLKPEIENTYKFKNFKDLNGKTIIVDWINNLKTKSEDYDTWTFYKVDDKEKQALKVGFYKLFEPYGFIISTADYLYRVEAELKKETIERIRYITEDSGLNFFIINGDGTTVLNKDYPSFENKHYNDFDNIKAKNIVKKLIDKRNRNGVYIPYNWKKVNSDIYQKKLSYVKDYEKWDWIIGTGVFFDDIEEIIKLKYEELKSDIIRDIILIALFMLLTLLIVYLITKRINLRIYNSLKIFLNFFKEINSTNQKINLDLLEYDEFSKIGQYANKMIETRIKNEKEIDFKNQEVLVNVSLLGEYKKAVDAAAVVSKTDMDGKIIYVNEQFCSISGYSELELINKNHNLVRHPDAPASLYKKLWKTILSKKIWKGVLKNLAKDGSTYYVKSTIIPILDIKGEIKEFIAIRYDVTDLIKQSKQIKFQTTDLLTKLPNRQKLLEDINAKDNLKLLIINIERFKEINEYYGYETGDKTLIAVSELFSELINDKNLKLFKLQGDVFAILGNEYISEQEFKDMSIKFVKEIKSIHLTIDENNLDIHFISGASFIRNYFINAEMARDHAKQENKRLVFFDENKDIKDNLINNVSWTKKLKKTIREDKIVVVAQPIISNKDRNVINKYECLVRIEDDDGSLISPMHFLNIAKKSKLYTKITQTIIEKAFHHFSKTTDTFSINLTIEDIIDNKTVEFIKEKINQYEGISNRLIFEIVEDEGIENYNEVINFIETMKYLGCSIAIDDFGTGYSNFDYLMKLNVDYVKIDGSMIRYLDHDENAKVVTELVVKFAEKLNIKTIAEFVHSEEIHDIVTKMGIDYSQGFYLGEPKRIS